MRIRLVRCGSRLNVQSFVNDVLANELKDKKIIRILYDLHTWTPDNVIIEYEDKTPIRKRV